MTQAVLPYRPLRNKRTVNHIIGLYEAEAEKNIEILSVTSSLLLQNTGLLDATFLHSGQDKTNCRTCYLDQFILKDFRSLKAKPSTETTSLHCNCISLLYTYHQISEHQLASNITSSHVTHFRVCTRFIFNDELCARS